METTAKLFSRNLKVNVSSQWIRLSRIKLSGKLKIGLKLTRSCIKVTVFAWVTQKLSNRRLESLLKKLSDIGPYFNDVPFFDRIYHKVISHLCWRIPYGDGGVRPYPYPCPWDKRYTCKNETPGRVREPMLS